MSVPTTGYKRNPLKEWIYVNTGTYMINKNFIVNSILKIKNENGEEGKIMFSHAFGKGRDDGVRGKKALHDLCFCCMI